MRRERGQRARLESRKQVQPVIHTYLEGDLMTENITAPQDEGKRIMDLIVMLLEDQYGVPYEYKKVGDPKEETA